MDVYIIVFYFNLFCRQLNVKLLKVFRKYRSLAINHTLPLMHVKQEMVQSLVKSHRILAGKTSTVLQFSRANLSINISTLYVHFLRAFTQWCRHWHNWKGWFLRYFLCAKESWRLRFGHQIWRQKNTKWFIFN